jgi:hypothetical protein
VLATHCSAHAPLFRHRIDGDACLRQMNGENETKCSWRGRIWAKWVWDWNGLYSTFEQLQRRIELYSKNNLPLSSLICFILVRFLLIPQ